MPEPAKTTCATPIAVKLGSTAMSTSSGCRTRSATSVSHRLVAASPRCVLRLTPTNRRRRIFLAARRVAVTSRPHSVNDQPTVDVVGRPRNIARFRAEKEFHQRGDVVHRSESIDNKVGDEFSLPLFAEPAPHDVRVDWTG